MKTWTRRLLLLTLVTACALALAAGGLAASGRSVVSGRYLRGSNGAHIVIRDDGCAIVLREQEGREGMFDALESGTRVLLLCDQMAQVYPAQSRAYWCVALGRGSPQDLPQGTLKQLAELGWLTAPL